jgi:hypothetical protein
MEILLADFTGWRLKQCTILFVAAVLTHQRYNFFGKLFAEPRDISTASLKDLCLFVRGTGLMNLC